MLEQVAISDLNKMIPSDEKPTNLDEEKEPKRPVQMIGFPLRYKSLGLQNIDDKTRDWIRGKIDNLLYWGPAGAGKTHLASAAMAASPLDKAYFIRVPEMLLEFQGSVKEHDELDLISKYSSGEASYYSKNLKVGRLFDDVGAHRVSDFSIEMFGLLLERLYSNCAAGLIFTSNLSPEQILDTMGERVSSRLLGLAKVVKIDGNDRRLKK